MDEGGPDCGLGKTKETEVGESEGVIEDGPIYWIEDGGAVVVGGALAPEAAQWRREDVRPRRELWPADAESPCRYQKSRSRERAPRC